VTRGRSAGIQVLKSSSGREFEDRGAEKGVGIQLEKGLEPSPCLFFFRRPSKELFCFQQTRAILECPELVRKTIAEPAAQFRAFPGAAQGGRLHEGAIRELINVAAPILDPADCRRRAALVGNACLRNQNRVITKGGKNRLVDFEASALHGLAQITGAQNPFEGVGIARIVSAEHGLPIGEKSYAAAAAVLGRIIVEELRRPLVLPHLHVPVV